MRCRPTARLCLQAISASCLNGRRMSQRSDVTVGDQVISGVIMWPSVCLAEWTACQSHGRHTRLRHITDRRVRDSAVVPKANQIPESG